MKSSNLKKIWENKKSIAVGIKNAVFKKEHVEALANERYQICSTCDLFDMEGTECVVKSTAPCCGKCGCSLKLKLRVPHEECPLNKWKSVASLEQSFQITDIINDKENQK